MSFIFILSNISRSLPEWTEARVRIRFQYAFGGLGLLLMALGLQGSVLPSEWSPYLLGIGAILFIVSIVLTVEGTERGRSIANTITTTIRGNRLTSDSHNITKIVGGDETSHKQVGLINVFSGGARAEAKARERRRTIRRQADRIESLPPNTRIEVEDIQDAIWLETPEKKLAFQLIQVWFRNVDPTQAVRQVSAEVRVSDARGIDLHSDFGRWVLGTKKENVGSWSTIQPKTDFLPNAGMPEKLNAFFKLPDRTECHIFNGEYSAHNLFGEELHVRIHLRGVGFDRTFHFRLLNTPQTFALLPQG
jgi:hypothetical protein